MKAFFSTALGKVIIGILAAAAVAGGGFAVYRAVKPEAESVGEVTEVTEEIFEAEEITTQPLVTTTPATTSQPIATTAESETLTLEGVNTTDTAPYYVEVFGENPITVFKWNSDVGYYEYVGWKRNADDNLQHGNVAATWKLSELPEDVKLWYNAHPWESAPDGAIATEKTISMYICEGDRLRKFQ